MLCSVLLRVNSELLHKAAKSPPEPKYPIAPLVPQPPTTFTLTSPPLTMVTVSPVTMNLYTNSCITARVIYQTVVWVFLTPWLLWRRRQTEKGKKRVCGVDVEEWCLTDALFAMLGFWWPLKTCWCVCLVFILQWSEVQLSLSGFCTSTRFEPSQTGLIQHLH